MANISDISRDAWMLKGPLSEKGYDWWWHSFTAENAKTHKKRPMFIEFFTCNPALAGSEPKIVWNDAMKHNQGEKPSYVMVKAGFWGKGHSQLHRFFSWTEVTISEDTPFSIMAGDCLLSETHTNGNILITEEDASSHPEWMSDSGSMSWNLSINKNISFNVGYGASKLFRSINSFEMFWHAEGMKTFFEGTVTINGEEYIVRPETCNGYSDKNWGGDFTSPWVWLSSNNLYSKKYGRKLENSVFDIGGGRPKIYSFALQRKLLGAFYYEGVNYEFNFSKFWTLSGTDFDCWEDDDYIYWHVDQTTLKHRLVTNVKCKKSDMLLVNYESPDGFKRHNRLWNGGNGIGVLKLYKRVPNKDDILIDEILAKGIGCEFGEY